MMSFSNRVWICAWEVQLPYCQSCLSSDFVWRTGSMPKAMEGCLEILSKQIPNQPSGDWLAMNDWKCFKDVSSMLDPIDIQSSEWLKATCSVRCDNNECNFQSTWTSVIAKESIHQYWAYLPQYSDGLSIFSRMCMHLEAKLFWRDWNTYGNLDHCNISDYSDHVHRYVGKSDVQILAMRTR